jgi:thiamine-phosphate diphosphorylase
VGPVLCLVTDRVRVGGPERLVQIVRNAADAGVHLVHIREKDLDARRLLNLASAIVAIVRGTRTRILVNDRADVAIAAGAHGVHLPATGAPAARVRAIAPTGFLIGRSVHSLDEGQRVVREGGLDYVVFGPVFETTSKPGTAAAGIDALRAVARALPLPVLAIGGVTTERFGSLAAAGAAGFAAIDLFAAEAREGENRLQTIVRTASLAFDTPPRVP